MAKEMIDLTSERDTIKGTVPYQFRPFIYINRRRNVRVFGSPARPRILALALLAVIGAAVVLARVVLGSER